jgi:hypothetical protein
MRIRPLSLAFFLTLSAQPVLAQEQVPTDGIERKLIIFGNDPCPAGMICVVAPETERYRIPKNLRQQKISPENQSWAVHADDLMALGQSGAGSCSASGSMGWTGCWQKQMEKARKERKEQAAETKRVP